MYPRRSANKAWKLCFEQLPVSKRNESWFLSPRTLILVKNGVQINFDTIIPHQYRINGEWYKLIPEFIDTEESKKLQLSTNKTWQFKRAKNLATSGIYTKEELSTRRKNLMFPLERPVILSSI